MAEKIEIDEVAVQMAYEELFQTAVNRFLDKIDFDPMDCLNEDEGKEYARLFELVHGYKLDGSDADVVDTTDGIGVSVS